eukprot:4079562-Amphidinium_carterae.1
MRWHFPAVDHITIYSTSQQHAECNNSTFPGLHKQEPFFINRAEKPITQGSQMKSTFQHNHYNHADTANGNTSPSSTSNMREYNHVGANPPLVSIAEM